MSSKKRLIWLDIAKGVAILSMVLGHCLESDLWLRIFIYSFHMPLFFVLAGFTMHSKPRKQVLVQSTRRLLVPYFAVCAILLFFAFVPPASLSSALDTQKSAPVVLIEILYGSGQEGIIMGHHFQAIGALWFLPCLFIARVIFNEILLASDKFRARADKSAHLSAHAGAWQHLFECACVGVCIWAGFALGDFAHLPFNFDTACIAVGFMFVGYLVKLVGIENIPLAAWVALFAVWMLYPYAGENEMAVRAYLDYPLSLVTAAAGSLVVMRVCCFVERIPLLSQGLAWCGVNSLYILCVHRVESAIFNWQKIMEFFRPDVWDWNQLAQGLYQFGLRGTLVVLLSIVVVRGITAAKQQRAQRLEGSGSNVPQHA
ncbi:MAG: acyltransferase family protein [Coriobacteriales bacterium]